MIIIFIITIIVITITTIIIVFTYNFSKKCNLFFLIIDRLGRL